MARWIVETRDAESVTLTRPMTVRVKVGSWVDIKRDKRWAKANNGQVLELGDSHMRVRARSINMRTRSQEPGPDLGEFLVPYTAIEEAW